MDSAQHADVHPKSTPALERAAEERNSRPGRKLIPLKIRRIKSDNLRRKSLSDIQQTNVFTIEPLTPPPQYDEKLPPLPTNAQQWGVLEVYTNTAVWWSVPTSFTHYYCTELHIPPLEWMCQYQQHRGGVVVWKGGEPSLCLPVLLNISFVAKKKKKKKRLIKKLQLTGLKLNWIFERCLLNHCWSLYRMVLFFAVELEIQHQAVQTFIS